MYDYSMDKTKIFNKLESLSNTIKWLIEKIELLEVKVNEQQSTIDQLKKTSKEKYES